MSKIARSDGVPAAEAAEDASVVRAMYRVLEEGESSDLALHAHAEIEWVHPMVALLPFDGTRQGLPAVLRNAFLRNANGTGSRVSAETFLEFGDGVLVAGRFIEEGSSAEKPFLHECFVRGGRVVLVRGYHAEKQGR